MSEPFLAQVAIFGFNFAPRGYAQCDGQILPINQNQSLFSLLGNTYGGDGRTNFALPDLRGRTPLHKSSSHPLGNKGGEENVTLTEAQNPSHQHTARASNVAGDNPIPATHVLARANNLYHAAGNMIAIHPQTTAPVGGQGHNNMQPFEVVNFCIAIQGLFPSRN